MLKTFALTCVELNSRVEAEQLAAQFPEFVDLNVSLPSGICTPQHTPAGVLHYYLQPLHEIYFKPVANPNFPSSISGDRKMIIVFSMISVLVLTLRPDYRRGLLRSHAGIFSPSVHGSISLPTALRWIGNSCCTQRCWYWH